MGLSYFKDGAWQEVAVGATGKILQVVQTVKTDTFTTNSTTFVDVTGFSVSITPSSTASKILVMIDAKVNGRDGVVMVMGRLLRDSTVVYEATSVGSRQAAVFGTQGPNLNIDAQPVIYLDSPATTSSVTYKLQMRANQTQNVHLNRSNEDVDSILRPRTASSITVMEVAA